MKLKNIIEAAVVRPDQIKLSEVSELNQIKDSEIRQELSTMYKSELLNLKLTASVINACITQQKVTFLFSKRILSDLVAKDSNYDRSSLSGDDYKKFVTFVKNNKILSILQMGKKIGEASVFEILVEEVIQNIRISVSQDYINAQRDACLRIHKSGLNKTSQSPSQVTSQVTSHEYNENNEYNNSNDIIEVSDNNANNSKLNKVQLDSNTFIQDSDDGLSCIDHVQDNDSITKDNINNPEFVNAKPPSSAHPPLNKIMFTDVFELSVKCSLETFQEELKSFDSEPVSLTELKYLCSAIAQSDQRAEYVEALANKLYSGLIKPGSLNYSPEYSRCS